MSLCTQQAIRLSKCNENLIQIGYAYNALHRVWGKYKNNYYNRSIWVYILKWIRLYIFKEIGVLDIKYDWLTFKDIFLVYQTGAPWIPPSIRDHYNSILINGSCINIIKKFLLYNNKLFLIMTTARNQI